MEPAVFISHRPSGRRDPGSTCPKGQLSLSVGVCVPGRAGLANTRLLYFCSAFSSLHALKLRLYAVSHQSEKHMFCSPAPALLLDEREYYWLHTNLLVLRLSNKHQALEEVLNLLFLRKRRGVDFGIIAYILRNNQDIRYLLIHSWGLML